MRSTVITLLSVVLACVSYSQSVWHDNQPYGDELDDIQFVDRNTGYVVGRDNGIGSCSSAISALFRTMDGGETWTRNALDDSYEMTSVFFLDRTTGWASVYFGDVIKTTDCGQTWTLYDGNIGGDALDVFFIDAQKGFLVGENGQVRISTDGGQSWSYNHDSGDQFLYKVEFYDDQLGFILGTQGLVLKTTDGGDSWEEIELGSNSAIFDIDFVSEEVIHLSSYGKVYRSTNGGDSFTEISLPVYSMRAIEFTSASVGFIAGEEGELWKTMDGGLTWDAIPFPFDEGIYAMTFLDTQNGYMSGRRGSIFHTSDGGESWVNQHIGLPWLRDVHFLNPDTGVVVGNAGHLSVTYNAGLTWSERPTPTEYLLSSVEWIGETSWVVAGDSGLFMLSADLGETWEVKETGTDQYIWDLWFTEDGSTGYLLCFEDTILKTTDLGDTWEVQVVTEGEFFRDFDFLDADFGVVVGNDFAYRTLDGGENWEERPVLEANSNLRCVEIVNDSLSYIGSTNTLISRNGGGFWDSISVSTSLFTDQMEFLNDSLGYMISGTNVRMTIDSGRHWSSVTTACLNNSWSLEDLDVIDEHHVHVAGQSPMRRMWSGPRTITTKVMDDSYCLGEKMHVGFYFDGYYITDNTYQAQLSDAAGDFSSQLVIGSYTNDFINRSPSGVISCAIPAGLPSGDGYRIRVVGVDPETIGSDNGFDISLVASLEPSIELTLETSGCGGTVLDFQTEVEQAGIVQSYIWNVDGAILAHDALDWQVDTLAPGSLVQVTLGIEASCTITSVLSNSIEAPEVVIPELIVSGDMTIVEGESVQLSASGFDSYIWSPDLYLDDPSIADPITTPDTTITYYVSALDSSGCAAIDSVTITVEPVISSVEGSELVQSIGPNPVEDILHMRFSHPIIGEGQVLDVQGKVVSHFTIDSHSRSLDLSILDSGPYLLQITHMDGVHSRVIIKN
ncbi:MAG: T9SS type A sorting domain-containing protein [Flavobacteriales bacterium]|nr:T9SS type A sorting domain-containing protein [Flavobacteriales bacterium]